MPKLSLTVPHNLTVEEAGQRLQGLLAKLKEKHGDKFSNLQEEWGESSGKASFSTYGFSVKTSVAVEQDQVRMDADLPFAAMMFKGKIEKEVRETLTRVLSSEPRPPKQGG